MGYSNQNFSSPNYDSGGGLLARAGSLVKKAGCCLKSGGGA